MSPQLKLAADSLLARLHVFGSPPPPSKTPGDWQAVVDFYRGSFPLDYVELMTQYPFDHVELVYTCLNGVREYPEYLDTIFRFTQPTQCPSESWHPELSEMGWCPVGEGDDGDFWAVRLERGIEGPVYFIRHTAWGGGPLTFESGLTWAAGSLAKLIAGFSFHNLRTGEWDFEKRKHEFDLRADLFDPPNHEEAYDFTQKP